MEAAEAMELSDFLTTKYKSRSEVGTAILQATKQPSTSMSKRQADDATNDKATKKPRIAAIPIAAKLTDADINKLWIVIAGWRSEEPGADGCYPLNCIRPWSMNAKDYIQLRASVVNENLLPTTNAANYKAVPATGTARDELPTHGWIDKDTKIQLSHLVARYAMTIWADGPRAGHAQAFGKFFAEKGVPGAEWASYELSHLCHNKACTNPEHLYPEASDTNKSRDYCPVVIYINGTIHNHCRHAPACIQTAARKAQAFKYIVPVNPM